MDASRHLKRSASASCEVLLTFHRKAALVILEYIKGTSKYGITTYQSRTLASVSLKVFAGADYASKGTDRRSASGGAAMCGRVYYVYTGFPGLREDALSFRLLKQSTLLSRTL